MIVPPGQPDRAAGRLAWCLTFVVCLAMLAATLAPASDWDRAKRRIFCVLCDEGSAFDASGNVLLFVPLGFCLSLISSSAARVVSAAAGLSLVIEVAQVFIPGRDPNLGDWIFNIIGSVLGWLIVQRTAATRGFASTLVPGLQTFVYSSERLQFWLSLGSAAVVAAILALTCLLLAPDFPSGPYHAGAGSIDVTGGPLHVGGNPRAPDVFRGSIDEVRIYDRSRDAAGVREDMARPVGRTRNGDVPGLVAAYDFDRDLEDVLIDASGHGHEGKLSRAAHVQGRFGQGLEFSGRAEDVVIIPHSPQLNLDAGMTIEAWVNPTSPQSGWGNIVQKDGDAYFLTAGSDVGRLRPAAGGSFGGMVESVKAPEPIPLNAWTHLAITYDGATLVLYVNGEPALTSLRWSRARVLDVSVGTTAIEPGRIDRPAHLRNELIEGAPIRVRFETLPPDHTLAPVLSLHDQRQKEVLFLGTESDDLVLRSRVLAERWGLATPALRLHGALKRDESGRPLTVTLSRNRARYCLEAAERRTCGLGFGIASGWTLFIDSVSVPPWLEKFFDLAWLGALFLAAGLCIRPCRVSYVAGAVLLLSLFALPLAGGFPATSWTLAAAAIAAFLAGYWWRGALERERFPS